MGADGTNLLGHSASVPYWHRFRMVCRIDLGYIEGLSPRTKCDRISYCCLRYFKSPFEVPHVFFHSTVGSCISLTRHKFVLVSLVRGDYWIYLSIGYDVHNGRFN